MCPASLSFSPCSARSSEVATPGAAERLGDRIAELASRIHAATYELLVLIRDFDVAGAWSGFASCGTTECSGNGNEHSLPANTWSDSLAVIRF